MSSMQTWNKRFWDYTLKTAALSLFLCCLLLPARSYAQLIKPAITAHPTNTIVSNAATATFKVEAYSLLGMSYSWYHNGVKLNNSSRISGANGATCTILNVGFADAGNYYVEVRNLVGPVDSDPATLSLLYPPVHIDSAQMVTNGLRMQMSGPNASNYVISASTNLANWTSISTNSATTGSVVFTDTTARTRSMRYYRAVAR
jgi:hypothetical protein